MRFVLASSSPRRKELLDSLGFAWETIKPDIDETQHEGENALDYVRRLSREKANSVVARMIVADDTVVLAADTIVLAADTIGVGGGEILGKPENAAQARAMLRRLREHPHTVYTAFRIVKISARPQGDPLLETVDDLVATRVRMRDYSDDEIERYIESGDPFDKAGSYAIQNAAFHPVAAIDGCYTNVVGLPLCAVRRGLAALHVDGADPYQSSEGCDCPTYEGRGK